jgi:DNA-binding NarL/FixJ family response regulator
MRQALIGLLSDEFPGWRFRQAGDLAAVEREISAEAVDLLVIDLGMPGMSGRGSLRALRLAHMEMRIAVLTSHDERSTILDSLAAGVHGYILKIDAYEQLLSAVRTILAGGIYVPAALSEIVHEPEAERLTESIFLPTPTASATLTGRQRDVLELLSEGRSTKEIARRLQLGLGTVKVHLAAIYRVLGARSRTEAVAKAIALRINAVNYVIS